MKNVEKARERAREREWERGGKDTDVRNSGSNVKFIEMINLYTCIGIIRWNENDYWNNNGKQGPAVHL